MTREEAIKELKELEYYNRPFDNSKEMVDVTIRKAQAVHIAIEALEQESFMNKPCVANQVCHEDKVKVLDKIRAEIDQLPTAKYGETMVYIINAANFKENVLEIIDKYKAESEFKDDKNI